MILTFGGPKVERVVVSGDSASTRLYNEVWVLYENSVAERDSVFSETLVSLKEGVPDVILG